MIIIRNNFKEIFKFSLIGMMIPFMFSCNKQLSREEAEKLIIQKYQLPKDDVREITLNKVVTTTFVTASKNEHQIPVKDAMLLNLEQNGLVTYTIKRTSSSIIDQTWWVNGIGNNTNVDFFTGKVNPNAVLKYTIKETYNQIVNLTQKGKQYLVNGNNFKVSTKSFSAITGIVETKGLNSTEVKYTVAEAPTPFGSAAFNLQGNTFESSAIFRKYDNGWRIEQ